MCWTQQTQRPRKGNTDEENADLEGRLEYLKIFEQRVT
jgi:hypothetical protein